MSEAPSRAQVWRRLGAPTDQIGSVNEPRTQQEQGRDWNEKWIYRPRHGDGAERVVLWNRYDFLGLFRVGENGCLEPEPLPET